jgi:hypothetical protein
MSAEAHIARLDASLERDGEDIIIRRVVGTAPNTAPVDIECRAKVTAEGTDMLSGGITTTTYSIIISPTQIREAQWPGGTVAALPPFDRDQSIPRAGLTDKVLMRGLPPIAIHYVDPVFLDGQWVRANMKATG